MLELNDVLINGETQTLSLMASERQITCIVGETRWLYAILGFEPVISGFISIDGEPLTPRTAAALRRQMAFAPHRLDDVGEIDRYEAPTAEDVFSLWANRQLSAETLEEETAKTGGGDPRQARLLAIAALLQRPILLVEKPEASMLPYLRRQASAGRIVIVTSTDVDVINAADKVVTMDATD